MSAGFWCWVPALALLPGSPGFLHRVDGFHQLPAKPPATEIVQFIGSLLKRYPDLTQVGPGDNTAWADGPLLNDANGGFIDLGVRWSYYAKVSNFVITTAHKHGLNCYDPQIYHYYPMKE